MTVPSYIILPSAPAGDLAELSEAQTWTALQTFGNYISIGSAQFSISSLTAGDIITYNGSYWVNSAGLGSRSNWRGALSSAPSTDLQDGDMYLNTLSRGLNFYYDGDWYLLHSLPTLAMTYITLETSTADFLLQEDGSSKIGFE